MCSCFLVFLLAHVGFFSMVIFLLFFLVMRLSLKLSVETSENVLWQVSRNLFDFS